MELSRLISSISFHQLQVMFQEKTTREDDAINNVIYKACKVTKRFLQHFDT